MMQNPLTQSHPFFELSQIDKTHQDYDRDKNYNAYERAKLLFQPPIDSPQQQP